MKKLFLLAIMLFAVTSCEREVSNGQETENKILKNETLRKQSDSATKENVITDVDPKDIILPPRR